MLNATFGLYAGIQAGAGPTVTRSENDFSQAGPIVQKQKGYVVNAGLSGGIVYFPDRRVGLQAGIGGLGWNYRESRGDKNSSMSSSTNANLDLTLFIGLHFFIART